MTALVILGEFLSDAWAFFTSLEIPGLNVHFASWFLAVALVKIAITSVRYAFGFGSSDTGYRSGSSRTKEISDKRKGDEF